MIKSRQTSKQKGICQIYINLHWFVCLFVCLTTHSAGTGGMVLKSCWLEVWPGGRLKDLSVIARMYNVTGWVGPEGNACFGWLKLWNMTCGMLQRGRCTTRLYVTGEGMPVLGGSSCETWPVGCGSEVQNVYMYLGTYSVVDLVSLHH